MLPIIQLKFKHKYPVKQQQNKPTLLTKNLFLNLQSDNIFTQLQFSPKIANNLYFQMPTLCGKFLIKVVFYIFRFENSF